MGDPEVEGGETQRAKAKKRGSSKNESKQHKGKGYNSEGKHQSAVYAANVAIGDMNAQ